MTGRARRTGHRPSAGTPPATATAAREAQWVLRDFLGPPQGPKDPAGHSPSIRNSTGSTGWASSAGLISGKRGARSRVVGLITAPPSGSAPTASRCSGRSTTQKPRNPAPRGHSPTPGPRGAGLRGFCVVVRPEHLDAVGAAPDGGAVMSPTTRDRAPRFPLISPAELAQPVEPVEFLIDGLWPAGSFGPWGGPKKSLKTHCASLAAVAVAGGVPALGRWPVRRARPVIYYGGEGGRDLHARRFQRIATEVYGLDLGDLPLYLVTGVGPFDTKEFRHELAEHCEAVEPGLVVLDSLYNYHPAGIEVGNLYDRGRVLSDLSHPLAEAGVALWVLDHFNKNGAGLDLDRLAQAGMAAWADSWVLLDHRSTPDVAEGRFALRAEVGSRQWGGAGWDIDLDIG